MPVTQLKFLVSRKVMMRPLALFSVLMLTACQAQTAPPVQELTAALRAELESELAEVFERLMEGARNTDPAALDLAAEGDGVCVTQTDLLPCNRVFQSYRRAWSSESPDRLVRQEMDGVEYEVRVLSPTLGYVASTTAENRAFRGTGEVLHASFANFFLWERQDGQWKTIAGQQASWPIEGN